MFGLFKYRTYIALSFLYLLVGCSGSMTDTTTDAASINNINNTNSTIVNTQPSPYNTGVATIDWLPPTENTDETALTNLVGYKIYYGSTPDNLSNQVIIPNPSISTFVIENLQTNTTYYFAVTAVNSMNIESVFSSVSSKYING